MGSITMLAVVALVLVFSCSEVFGQSGKGCPLPSKSYSCSPKCVENYECTHGKLCCPNSCNAKSCVEPGANGASGGNDKDKYAQRGGAGTYCNNVKCSSFEVCKLDPNSKRMKCLRP